jgi:hypothetical protein
VGGGGEIFHLLSVEDLQMGKKRHGHMSAVRLGDTHGQTA